MAITPTYSWPLPDNDDLVKDGAEAIRDLGNAIDTTVDGLGIGLVHIKTESFSGAVSHSFGSDADPIFSSNFRNYLIILDNTKAATSNQVVGFRLRVDTSDITTGNYFTQRTESITTTVSAGSTASATSARIGTFPVVEQGSIILNLYSPFESIRTMFSYQQSTFVTNLRNETGTGLVNLNTSANGFTFFGSTNLSGTMSVYGYKI
jgi:hypothetical protein